MKTTPKIKEYGLERVDLQLLDMFEDAKKDYKLVELILMKNL